MKNLIALLLVIFIASCTVGELKADRKKLYEMGNDICEKDPSRCVNGIPW